VAALLEGCSPEARVGALAVASDALAATRVQGAGVLCASEPWLFKEAEVPGQPAYMTPLLRTRLHSLFRGASGTERPAVVFGDVCCGDVVTLVSHKVDGAYVLSDLMEEVEETSLEDITDSQRDEMHSGRSGIVVTLGSQFVSVRMPAPSHDLLYLNWDAVVSCVAASEAASAAPRCSSRPTFMHYARIVGDPKSHCDAAHVTWHPDMQTFAGRWVLVTGSNASTFTSRLKLLSHMFPYSCCEEVVRVDDVL